MKFKNFLIFIFFICSDIATGAQPMIVKLWPDGTPHSISIPSLQERPIQAGNQMKFTGVVNPEIHIYQAPKVKATGTAVVICPGGGYEHITFTKEGEEIAQWFNEHGITGIVLKYRLPSDSIMEDKSMGPLIDAQEALRIVRRNADTWGIDKTKIGVMGFSAGGHLASTLSTQCDERIYVPTDSTSARPDFTILVYPVISMMTPITHAGSRFHLLGDSPDTASILRFSNDLHVSSNTPPTFLVHSTDDGVVSVENSVLYFKALRTYNVKSDMRLYHTGGHGFGLAKNGKTECEWPGECLRWMKECGF